MPNDIEDREEQAAIYRESAARLRSIAATLRFDLCRREQLYALAAGFDRLAARLDAWPLSNAAAA